MSKPVVEERRARQHSANSTTPSTTMPVRRHRLTTSRPRTIRAATARKKPSTLPAPIIAITNAASMEATRTLTYRNLSGRAQLGWRRTRCAGRARCGRNIAGGRRSWRSRRSARRRSPARSRAVAGVEALVTPARRDRNRCGCRCKVCPSTATTSRSSELGATASAGGQRRGVTKTAWWKSCPPR